MSNHWLQLAWSSRATNLQRDPSTEMAHTLTLPAEAWDMVIPFAVEAWLTTCLEFATDGKVQDSHSHYWCSSCVKENNEDDDTMGPFFFRGCRDCNSVRALRAVSTRFDEAVGDTYAAAHERDMCAFIRSSIAPMADTESNRAASDGTLR